MDEQEQIKVSLQLPASALDSLSRLAEQLRKLTAAVSGWGRENSVPEEFVESGTFDPERFLALRQKAEQAESVRAKASSQLQDPELAEAHFPEGMEDPATETDGGSAVEPEDRREEAVRETSPAEEIPTTHLAAEEVVPDPPAVRAEVEKQTADAGTAQARTEERDIPLPAARAGRTEDVPMPQGAGVVVTAQPEPPANRWSGVTEELITAGPAPLTAEAVSLAFQRDGRRYDNGFPLY